MRNNSQIGNSRQYRIHDSIQQHHQQEHHCNRDRRNFLEHCKVDLESVFRHLTWDFNFNCKVILNFVLRVLFTCECTCVIECDAEGVILRGLRDVFGEDEVDLDYLIC